MGTEIQPRVPCPSPDKTGTRTGKSATYVPGVRACDSCCVYTATMVPNRPRMRVIPIVFTGKCFGTSSTILVLKQYFRTCKGIEDVRCSRFGWRSRVEASAFYSLVSMGCDWGTNGDKRGDGRAHYIAANDKCSNRCRLGVGPLDLSLRPIAFDEGAVALLSSASQFNGEPQIHIPKRS